MSRTERPNGYLRLARKLFDGADPFWPTPFRDRFSRGEAWVDLIQMAAWHNGAVLAGIQLQRGEFCGSVRWFARRWSWSVNAVRGFFEQLESKCRIRARTKARTWARTPSVYVLVNYAVFNPESSDTDTDMGTDLGTEGTRTRHKDEEVEQGRSTTDAKPDATTGDRRRKTRSSPTPRRTRETWLTGYLDDYQATHGVPVVGKFTKPFSDLEQMLVAETNQPREVLREERIRPLWRSWLAERQHQGKPAAPAWFSESFRQLEQRAVADDANPYAGWHDATEELGG